MNDAAQLIISISTLITAVGTLALAWVNRGTINTIQQHTNGMVKKLEEAAHDRGKRQGRAEKKRDPT